MKKYLFKLLKFVTIALIAIVLVELLCVIIKVPKISHNNIYSKSQDLIPQINSNTILFIGDSRVEWGIKPIVIKEILNNEGKFNVINMAMPLSNGLDILSYLKEKNIYPKLIVLGYTINYGRYTNHNLDKEKYSNRNRIIENIRYSMKQIFYVIDYESIIQYLMGKHPVNMNHEYDKWGGVNLEIYGDYLTKKSLQMSIYKDWSETFSKDEYLKYYSTIEQLNIWFSQGETKIIGLSMPVSKSLNELEIKNTVEHNVLELFDKSYNYSKLYQYDNPKSADSVYFIDGSHLTLEYAKLFSQKLGYELKKEIN